MQDYQREFIEFAREHQVLRFGDFVLKSGRKSPYFFNSGLFNTGASLGKLGEYYARAIADSGLDFDVLYGPAYKGIPLAASIAIARSRHGGLETPYCFNRKEAKDHGEGGNLVGAELSGRVVIVDDVISAGTSTRESIEIIAAANAQPVGLAVALDRQERGAGKRYASAEIEQDMGLKVISIVNLDTLVSYLEGNADLGRYEESIREYRAQYGAASDA
ncbi:MAG: orotate phosphoribosyltransferase [Gammaproteobacteria bacterium]|nr:orotate phosphoribosyltransferase [Gammaproteobacteria bacterium]